MHKEIPMWFIVTIIIVVAVTISGCVENTNTKHNLNDNISGNISGNTGDNYLNSADNSDNNPPSSPCNATTGENKDNIIVVITVSNDALLKISVKNVEIYSKIYGWKVLSKTPNKNKYVGNFPAGTYDKIRIGINNVSAIRVFNISNNISNNISENISNNTSNKYLEIPVNFSLNETGKISINFNLYPNPAHKIKDEKNLTMLLTVNADVFEMNDSVTNKIFVFEIDWLNETNEADKTNKTNKTNHTYILNCKEQCEKRCKNKSVKEKCRVNALNIEEECVSKCWQNLYSSELTERCMNEINERCRIKCETEGMNAENRTQCNFRCKMNSLRPCVEKYIADERNKCVSQCRINATSQCSTDTDFECLTNV